MKFDVDPKIFSFFPGMHLVVAIPETLTNSDSEGLVSSYWNQAWLAAGNLDLPNAQSHPHVRQFREQFQGILGCVDEEHRKQSAPFHQVSSVDGSGDFRFH